MKFLAVAAIASVAVAAPFSKDVELEPTRTIPHERPSGTGHYHPHGTGHHSRPAGTGVHHPHRPHGTGVAHGTGRPHHHPHGTGISHSGHARPTEFHGPYEKPSSGFTMPTNLAILPRDEAEEDVIDVATGAAQKTHKHNSGAANPTGHHHHKGGEHGHAKPTGHHKGGEHGHAKPTGGHRGGEHGHAKSTKVSSAAGAEVTPTDSANTGVEKRADAESDIMATPVMGFPSGAARPTGHHSHESGRAHGTGSHKPHRPHGTGFPHPGKPHGTGRPGHHGPRPTGGFHWGPGIEITPEMASSLFAEHGHAMPTGFFSSLFAAHSQHGGQAKATPEPLAAGQSSDDSENIN